MRTAATYPRLRYMGSKHRLVPRLAEVFRDLDGRRALDAFCGSGVVAYTMKELGYRVTANDFLVFPTVVAQATVANSRTRLSDDDLAILTGPPADDRDFVRRTFDGLYFTPADLAFLDSAWSHIDGMEGDHRALAIAALILAAARKQPRGVFTVTSTAANSDDGRRQLRQPLRELFVEAAAAYNAVVFDNGQACSASNHDVFELTPGDWDVVYLDPPYAPPRDDNCYVKRYHFLEGLAVYWRGQQILEHTRTKKLPKRYTPFSYRSTAEAALRSTFERFADSAIVLSYSSNAVPDAATIERHLRAVKDDVTVHAVDHRYHFGTHARATRTQAREYLFVGR